MYYGHERHVHSPDDLTILKCFCGWMSEELTVEKKVALGLPWYCADCGRQSLQFVTFHPIERRQAYDAIGKSFNRGDQE